ncbi:MAG: hypothetical protein ACLT8E_02105 [Akkermansia sp.]
MEPCGRKHPVHPGEQFFRQPSAHVHHGNGRRRHPQFTLAADPSGIARVEVSAYVNTDAAAFAGNWTVGPGVELTMNGTDTKTAGSGWERAPSRSRGQPSLPAGNT